MKANSSSSPEPTRADDTPHPRRGSSGIYRLFDKFAGKVTGWSGSPATFSLAFLLVLTWAVSGPLFGFSETWQLVINTGTTIITFLMVFLIQHGQNKDSEAVHLKLNELLASHPKASNRLICIEDLGEDELQKLTRFYRKLAELAEDSVPVATTHSLRHATLLDRHKHELSAQSAVPPTTPTSP